MSSELLNQALGEIPESITQEVKQYNDWIEKYQLDNTVQILDYGHTEMQPSDWLKEEDFLNDVVSGAWHTDEVNIQRYIAMQRFISHLIGYSDYEEFKAKVKEMWERRFFN